ncbi:GGDEF domain-containing protein [Hansschlegelia zhihuaiae]|uniref:GGDEF domain-containing protein n=1 Tax=Hansschlegelia zhihuaiae TaxID=405005 RepID=A0A4Q0MLN7_9HYPH|nr:GGDEF domain-containing protein [Hansschlegelia zhihuaiae]RXF74345.1 GGDEF domain-containing protein [Hansschlegelia zhihuaiae]
MHAFVMRVIFPRILAFANLISSGTSLVVCYAVGFLASQWIGDGAAGQPLITLAAPAALALLVRSGGLLRATDAACIAIVHVALATTLGEPAPRIAPSLAASLTLIACGALIFARLRAVGFITSQLRLAAAVTIVSVVGAVMAAPIDLLISDLSAKAMAVRAVSVALGSILVLMLVMTYERDRAGLTSDNAIDDPKPSWKEHLAAVALVAALVVGSIGDGRQEAALGASVALLWFAIRFGLFPTALAVFSFAIALLTMVGAGQWPVLGTVSDPLSAELMRYLALALLAAPSLIAAAAVHDQKRLRRMFAYRATHDGLTTLTNRSRFLEVLEEASAGARSRGKRFTLLLIDLDFFKSVNDGYGHARGDGLLVEVSNRLRQSTRATDLVSRIGGDEFSVVAPVRTVEDAMALAKRLVETVNQPCEIGGVTFIPSVTIGGVLAPDSATDPQRLMLLADEALYQAKAAGRNCWRFSASTDEPPLLPVWRSGELEPAPETVFLD